MTKVINNDDRSKLPAYFCISQIKERDARYKENFSPAQVCLAEEVLALAKEAFFRSRVYMNYRDKFIAVKIDRPTMADRISSEAISLHSFCTDAGIEAVNTASALIYRIKR